MNGSVGIDVSSRPHAKGFGHYRQGVFTDHCDVIGHKSDFNPFWNRHREEKRVLESTAIP